MTKRSKIESPSCVTSCGIIEIKAIVKHSKIESPSCGTVLWYNGNHCDCQILSLQGAAEGVWQVSKLYLKGNKK